MNLDYISSNYWAILPSALHDMVARLKSGRDLARVETPEPRALRAGPGRGKRSIGVIPISGVIDRADDYYGSSTLKVGAVLRQMVDDERIGGIMLDIDSPGGNVFGIDELASEIRAARKVKPVAAHTSGMMASAAYWLGAQADRITASPSTLVGSIGVYTVHEDMSQALENAGVKMTMVSAGEHKVDGNPFEPLADEARVSIQSRVNTYYDMFVNSVAKGRGVTPVRVNKDYGQGRVFNAADAKERGLIDRVSAESRAFSDASNGVAANLHFAWTGEDDIDSLSPSEFVELLRKNDGESKDKATVHDIDRRRRALSLQRQKTKRV